MSGKRAFYRVGVFVLAAAVVAVAGVMSLGIAQKLRPVLQAETYLDESAQGLEVGSPVKYRGVKIGSVEAIELAASRYSMPDGEKIYGRYVMVELGFDPKKLNAEHVSRLEDLIREGLRIRLASAGLTGVAYLELDFLDVERNPPLKLAWTPRTIYLPSAPSTATRLVESIDRTLASLEQMHIDRVATDVRELVVGLTKMIKEDLSPTLQNINATAKELPAAMEKFKKVEEETEGLIAKLQGVVDKDLAPAVANVNAAARDLGPVVANLGAASKDMNAVSKELPATVVQVNRTLKRVDQLATGQQDTIEELLENLRTVSKDVKELTGYAKRYPSHLLFGEPPKNK